MIVRSYNIYVRATRSTRSASVQGSKIHGNGTTETYVETDTQSKIKVDESSQNTRRRTLRSMELQRNKNETNVQGDNVKIKQEQLDLSLEEMAKQTSDFSSDMMESSDEEESIIELSDSSDNFADGEEKEDVMDAEVAEIETKMRNSIAVNRKPWDGYGSSRKKIKKYYSDVSEYRQKSSTESSLEEGDRTRNNDERQEWENQTSLIHKLRSRTKTQGTTASVNTNDRTDKTIQDMNHKDHEYQTTTTSAVVNGLSKVNPARKVIDETRGIGASEVPRNEFFQTTNEKIPKGVEDDTSNTETEGTGKYNGFRDEDEIMLHDSSEEELEGPASVWNEVARVQKSTSTQENSTIAQQQRMTGHSDTRTNSLRSSNVPVTKSEPGSTQSSTKAGVVNKHTSKIKAQPRVRFDPNILQ